MKSLVTLDSSHTEEHGKCELAFPVCQVDPDNVTVVICQV